MEERIRVYSSIMQDNEQTIEKFRDRVMTLELEIQNMQRQSIDQD